MVQRSVEAGVWAVNRDGTARGGSVRAEATPGVGLVEAIQEGGFGTLAPCAAVWCWFTLARETLGLLYDQRPPSVESEMGG